MPLRKKITTKEKSKPLQRVDEGHATIECVKNHQDALWQELAVETQTTKEKTTSTSSKAELKRIQDQVNVYVKKIDIERAKIEQLDQSITKIQARILEQRKKVGSDTSSKENADMIEKHVRILENRLNQALVKFNEKVAQNKELRRKIDDLRQERVVFDGIYKKLERELSDKAREMTQIIEDGRRACKARDQAQTELMALKCQAQESKEAFEAEWRELGRLIEEDRKIQEDKRKEKSNAIRAGRLSVQGSLEGAEKGDTSNLPDQRKEDNEHQEGSKDTSEADNLNIVDCKEQDFDAALERIVEATGIENVDDIITQFLEAEEKNFSLFNYVAHELTGEIERLEAQIATVKKEVAQAKGQGVSADTQRKKELRLLEDKKVKIDAKATEYEKRYEAASDVLQQLKTGIASIYSRIGCSRVNKMLGDQGVTESNIMEYLAVIEQRTTEIMQTYNSSHSEESASMVKQKSDVSDTNRDSSRRLRIDFPTADDFSSGDESGQEDDERPLTREELQQKTWRGMKIDKNGRMH